MGLFDKLFGGNRPQPTESQLEYAKSLGVDVVPGMTFDQVSQRISIAEAGLEKERDQRRKERENADRLREPTQHQLDLCRLAGIQLKPEWNRGQVEQVLEKGRHHGKYKAKLDAAEFELQRQAKLEGERGEREEYGDKFVDHRNEWKRNVDSGGHWLIIFRRGKNVVVVVVELEYAEISDSKKPSVEIGLFLPKLRDPKDDDPEIAWEKEATVKTDKILFAQRLENEIDFWDLKAYNAAVESVTELAKSFDKGN